MHSATGYTTLDEEECRQVDGQVGKGRGEMIDIYYDILIDRPTDRQTDRQQTGR